MESGFNQLTDFCEASKLKTYGQSNIHKYNSLCNKTVLVVEDDYVNFLLIKEIFESAKMQVRRAISINDAVDSVLLHSNVDLIIINNSLTWSAHSEIIHYLKEEYSVPVVVMIGNKAEENSRSQKVVDWVDCALTINSDFEMLFEAVSELV